MDFRYGTRRSHGSADVYAVDGVAGGHLFLGIRSISLCGSLSLWLWSSLQHEVKAVSLGDFFLLNLKVTVLFATKLTVQEMM